MHLRLIVKLGHLWAYLVIRLYIWSEPITVIESHLDVMDRTWQGSTICLVEKLITINAQNYKCVFCHNKGCTTRNLAPAQYFSITCSIIFHTSFNINLIPNFPFWSNRIILPLLHLGWSCLYPWGDPYRIFICFICNKHLLSPLRQLITRLWTWHTLKCKRSNDHKSF